jgi:zinc transporter
MASTMDNLRFDPSPAHGLWLGLRLDEHGRAEDLDWDALLAAAPEQRSVWAHLDPRVDEARALLRDHLGITEPQLEALLRIERRSGIEQLRGGRFAVSVYGPEPAPGLPTRDFVAIRMLIEPRRVVSVSSGSLSIVSRARSLYAAGRGPATIPELVFWMAATLGEVLDGSAMDLEVPMADLEHAVDARPDALYAKVRDVVVEITRVRRHLVPFQVLVSRLALTQEDNWLVKDCRAGWQRLADQADDTAAVLQALLDRARALGDEISERVARRTNHILYVLTVLSSVTLPLSLLVGFLGINVGIVDSNLLGLSRPIHVGIVCAALGVLAASAHALIKRLDLL